MASKRLATGFEGTTNPGTDLDAPAAILDNLTGVMNGILRTGGGLSGQAGDIRTIPDQPAPSSLNYSSRSVDPLFAAEVAGAEFYFCPRQGTPDLSGGAMPGVQAFISWSAPDDTFGSITLSLYGGSAPGPFVEATLYVDYDNGLGVVTSEQDLTGHDWFGWHRMTWGPSGDWSVATLGGTVLASGSLPEVPADGTLEARVEASNYTFVPGDPAYYGAGALVDDLSVWIAGSPAIRMFPRDDGRGMSSAPRIWPAPKSQRIIGGHQ